MGRALLRLKSATVIVFCPRAHLMPETRASGRMFLCPPVICRQAELQKSGSAPPFACDRRPPRTFWPRHYLQVRATQIAHVPSRPPPPEQAARASLTCAARSSMASADRATSRQLLKAGCPDCRWVAPCVRPTAPAPYHQPLPAPASPSRALSETPIANSSSTAGGSVDAERKRLFKHTGCHHEPSAGSLRLMTGTSLGGMS